MGWNDFNKTVRFLVGENQYDLPIWDMSVVSGPYSRETGDGTHILAFDGRRYTRHQGWRTRIEIRWPEMIPSSHQELHDFIVDLATTGVCTAVLNPDGNSQLIDMVLENAEEALVATFDMNTRRRPASINLVSQNISLVAPTWITDNSTWDTMYAAIQNNEVGANDNYLCTIYRDEANIGSWDYDLYPISQATYGTGLSVRGNFEVDEAEGIAFLTIDNTIYSFSLTGVPIGVVHPDTAGVSLSALAIDRNIKRLYISTRTGGAPDPYIVTIYELQYDGTVDRVVWAKAYSKAPSLNKMAFGRDGYLYLFEHESLEPTNFIRVNVSSGVREVLAAGVVENNNAGPADADISLGLYITNNVGTNDITTITIPAAGGLNTLYEVPEVAINDCGTFIDGLQGKIYWVSSQRAVSRSDPNGANVEMVADLPNTPPTGTYIYGLTNGR